MWNSNQFGIKTEVFYVRWTNKFNTGHKDKTQVKLLQQALISFECFIKLMLIVKFNFYSIIVSKRIKGSNPDKIFPSIFNIFYFKVFFLSIYIFWIQRKRMLRLFLCLSIFIYTKTISYIYTLYSKVIEYFRKKC